ncbi:Transcriptional adapter 3 [Portunus trituberculatus]|uniref:Transcriptional adapter 3 n=1 Tax=Portunus trituberculatus TaxID=210409 RepID=A0A5B7HK90_PORTR|nr:Transcriptional adapter 3 [Portunus trituberculatus]
MELRRCQTELRAVSNHNISQLTRLLNLARDSLVRHDLKKRLRDADQKVRWFGLSIKSKCLMIRFCVCLYILHFPHSLLESQVSL